MMSAINQRTTTPFERVLIRYARRNRANVTQLSNYFNISHEDALNVVRWEKLNPGDDLKMIQL